MTSDPLDEFFTGSSDGLGGVGNVPDAPADDLLQRITLFLQGHNKQLNEMRETLSETTTEAWNEENYTVRLNMVSQSRADFFFAIFLSTIRPYFI